MSNIISNEKLKRKVFRNLSDIARRCPIIISKEILYLISILENIEAFPYDTRMEEDYEHISDKE